ncbi:cutinase family protein [Mycobacterium sp.]|uniref:cutinase family protein n=1 Tax=Mycobacterium sp. TaxID=1785 RepID=UPI003A88CCBA
MIARILGSVAAVAAGLSSAVITSATPTASAAPCPDVHVMFARGTDEDPGVGPTGQAFVDALLPRVPGKSLDVYAVDYPATEEWATGIEGIRDAGTHLVSMVGSCPDTQMVLGGFSQGAAVMGFVTSAVVPYGIDPVTVPRPLDPEVAEHVSSVVLFGAPNARAMEFLGTPAFEIGPLYQAKTIQVCAPEDPVCSDGMNFAAHTSYPNDAAMIDEGAAFAAARLGGASAPAPAGFGD